MYWAVSSCHSIKEAFGNFEGTSILFKILSHLFFFFFNFTNYFREPRGFAFVKFRFPEDAAEAKDRLNNKIVGGREIRIVYAEENRKTPKEMRMSTHIR